MIVCADARFRIHARLDGDLAPDSARELEVHLAACPECRRLDGELGEISAGLKALPLLEMPDAAFEQVLDGTVRARRAERFRRAPAWRAWAAAAAAAVLAGALLLVARPPVPVGPSPAELSEARRQASLVLNLTARTLHRVERSATERVLAREVGSSLRRVPVRWSSLHMENRS